MYLLQLTQKNVKHACLVKTSNSYRNEQEDHGIYSSPIISRNLANRRLTLISFCSELNATNASTSLMYCFACFLYWTRLSSWMTLGSRLIRRDVMICLREQATGMRTFPSSSPTFFSYVFFRKCNLFGLSPPRSRSSRRTLSM